MQEKMIAAAPRPLLSMAEVAQAVKRHPSTVWRWYQDGRFPRPIYLRELRYWYQDEVAAWLQAELSRPPEARRRGRGLRHNPPLAPVPEPESR